MTDQRREQVRENALYLREVRPLDPAELSDYVEGAPHPAVVRTDLRALAPDLGLIEREDGTFVPAPEGPVDPTFDGVDRLPDRYAAALADQLVERYGPDWDRGDTGEQLRGTVDRLKAQYHDGRAVSYDADTACAYAVYHLADYYAATQYVLDALGQDGLLPGRLRVLEVGAGVGGPALGVADYVPDDALLVYDAVEPSDPAADLLDALAAETGRNAHLTVHRETAESFDPAGPYDLLLFSNVLSELDAPADTVARYLDALAPDGTAALVAPADERTSVGMRAVEREVADERDLASVYGPTVRLWPGRRPTDRGWSFDERPEIAVPPYQERLAAPADDPATYQNVGVRFSYSLLRTDGRRRHDLALTRERAAPMADAADSVTRRVDLVCAKLSRDLSTDGHPVFKVSDGSEAVEHYAVLVEETALNEALARAGYGALLAVEGGLVLYNDDEDGYNVVVDDETVVDVLVPGRG